MNNYKDALSAISTETDSLSRPALVLINPIAGTKGHVLAGKAAEVAETLGADTIVWERADQGQDIYEKIMCHPSQTVIAVGGDGTINLAASAAVESGKTLGIIPSGSGNGLARHLRVPFDLEKAVDVINRGNIRHIDAGRLNDKFFFCTAGIGFDAAVTHQYATCGRRGLSAYISSTLKILGSYRPGSYRIRLENGETISTGAFILSFANSSQFGNNFTIAPGASPEDGRLNLSILRPFPKWQMPALLTRFFTASINGSGHFQNIPFRSLTIEQRPHTLVHVDGEALTIDGQIHLEVMPGALKVLAP